MANIPGFPTGNLQTPRHIIVDYKDEKGQDRTQELFFPTLVPELAPIEVVNIVFANMKTRLGVTNISQITDLSQAGHQILYTTKSFVEELLEDLPADKKQTVVEFYTSLGILPFRSDKWYARR